MNFSRLTLLKLIELVLAIAIFWMHWETFQGDGNMHLIITTTTFGGFLIVVGGTFLGLITGAGINKSVDMFFCVAGAVLYITSGIMAIQHFQGWKYSSSTSNLGITKGSVAIIQAVIFILDAFFVFRAE